jgi:hypothetical protein
MTGAAGGSHKCFAISRLVSTLVNQDTPNDEISPA